VERRNVVKTLTVPLPKDLQEFVESQTAAGGYVSPADYVTALLHAVQKRQAIDKVNAMLLEGMQSEMSEMTADDWKAIRKEVEEGLANRAVKRRSRT
jgi:antitoxin ParD1/3/4